MDPVEQQIAADGKEAYVRALFESAAPAYDRSSTLMSFGLFPRWHRAAIGKAGLRPGQRVLDVACGTGGLTLLAARAVVPRGKVTGVDFSPAMLAVAGQKLRSSPHQGQITLVEGNAMALAFPDDHFDCVLMGFALRNIADPGLALAEMVRVTRPGGRILNMDIAIPTHPLLRWIHNSYMSGLLPLFDRMTGRLWAGHPHVQRYRYLAGSHDYLPDAAGVTRLLLAAGAVDVKAHSLFGGAVVIWVGVKPQA